jgi:hypothetical protein
VDVGAGAIQRTHHWSPLSDEVEFVRTAKDVEMASFDCAKDRHVFPWVDVNVRFGFIRYASDDEAEGASAGDDPMFPATSTPVKSRHHTPRKEGWHPLKLVDSASKLR